MPAPDEGEAPALRAFAQLAPDAERVAAELGQALGVLTCRAAGHPEPAPCPDCQRIGRDLTGPVGRALLAVAPRNKAGKVTLSGAESVGRGIEALEVAARLRPRPYPRDPLLTGE